MAPSLLTMAKDLVMAHIQAGHATPEMVAGLLNNTYTTLEGLQAAEESGHSAAGGAGNPVTSVSWKASINPHAVTCLECGATFKQLSTRHLRTHDLDGRSYRLKYGIPRTQSLSAREVLARRRQIVQRIRPWEKSPTSSPDTEMPTAAAKRKTKGPAKSKAASPKKGRTRASS